MNKRTNGLFIAVALAVATTLSAQSYRLAGLVDSTLDVAVRHYRHSLAEHDFGEGYPASVIESGSRAGQLRTVDRQNWVSGFYPGVLWYLYEATGDDDFRAAARQWTEGLAENQRLTSTHDLGFMIYNSYGNGYRLTGDRDYRGVLVRTAANLSSRFNAEVGCIKSWDWGGNRWQFPVIVDNLMNLELLTAVAGMSGREAYTEQAMRHADQTGRHHIRADYTTYHVVDFSPTTGEVIRKMTYQGYSDASLWARGQAWAIYGYTMLHRETGEDRYRDLAEQLLVPYLAELPEDGVPYWDFDDPAIPAAPRDASAAAIVASALLELYALNGRSDPTYLDLAEHMLQSLAGEEYLARPGSNANFILRHATGNKPAGREIDVPLIYADYYFVEALLRYRRLSRNFRDDIGAVTVEEDAGPTVVIADLPNFLGADSSNYAITIYQFNEGIELAVSDQQLVVTPAPDYFGQSRAELIVDYHDSTVAYAFPIEVVPRNDAPTPFRLTHPADDERVNSGNILFRWEEAEDVDGDTVTYRMRLSGGGLDTVFTDLTEPKLRFPGEDMLIDGVTYSWYVVATDQSATTTSSTHTFTLPGTVSVTEPKVIRTTVYPNPFDRSFRIEWRANGAGRASLRVVDGMGRICHREELRVKPGRNILSVTLDLPPGTYGYTLRLIDEGRTARGLLIRSE